MVDVDTVLAMDDSATQPPTGTDPTGAAGRVTDDLTDDLTDEEVAILALERLWWKYPGAKETAVQDRFGWTMTRYYQVLNALIDTSAALAHDPVTVNRLRRLRDHRTCRPALTQPH